MAHTQSLHEEEAHGSAFGVKNLDVLRRRGARDGETDGV